MHAGSFALLGRPRNHIDSPSFRGEANGIFQEVLEHLAQAPCIACDGRDFLRLVSGLIPALQMERKALPQRLRYVLLSQGKGLAHDRRNIQQAIGELKGACLELSDLEMILQALAACRIISRNSRCSSRESRSDWRMSFDV